MNIFTFLWSFSPLNLYYEILEGSQSVIFILWNIKKSCLNRAISQVFWQVEHHIMNAVYCCVSLGSNINWILHIYVFTQSIHSRTGCTPKVYCFFCINRFKVCAMFLVRVGKSHMKWMSFPKLSEVSPIKRVLTSEIISGFMLMQPRDVWILAIFQSSWTLQGRSLIGRTVMNKYA